MPKVSVHIPCFNSALFIKETLESVLTQTYKDFEVIVMDDGSTDSTGEIIKSFSDPRIKYFYKENEGLSETRNKCIAVSKGEYIAFLDHDDLWMPAKLEKQVKMLDDNKDVGLVYTNYFRMHQNGKKELVLRGNQPQGEVFGGFLYFYPVGILTTIVRRSALNKLDELFDRNLDLCEEYDLFMRLVRVSKAAYLDEPTAVYRIHRNMQSVKAATRYPEEFNYVFRKFEKIDPNFKTKYAEQIIRINAMVSFGMAKAAMLNNDPIAARKLLKSCKWTNCCFPVLYTVTFFPTPLVCRIDAFYDKYILRNSLKDGNVKK